MADEKLDPTVTDEDNPEVVAHSTDDEDQPGNCTQCVVQLPD
jgi:hypothetical protein